MHHVQRRVLIVTGGHIGAWAIKYIRPDDILIGADRGALFLIQHGFHPNLAIGDFDSVTEEERALIRSQSQIYQSCDAIYKDESDTELAFSHAIQLQPAEIILLGALGTRFDHTLANVHLLHKATTLGVKCTLFDEYNIIRLTDSTIEIAAVEGFPYVSLLPLTPEVSGVTLEGFQYSLHDATLKMGNSLSISNILIAEAGHIHIRTGQLLVVQSRD